MSIYGTAPIFLTHHQPSRLDATGRSTKMHIPTLNLQELFWKLWKCLATEACCSRSSWHTTQSFILQLVPTSLI